MKWRGEFEILSYVYPNEILSSGLTYLGDVLTTNASDFFLSIRLEDALNNEVATEAAAINYAVAGNELTITSIADYPASSITSDVAFAVLLSNAGVEIARAAVVAASGQAVEVTRRDIFTVNA